MRPADHDWPAMLRAGRLIAAELAGEAVDPETTLTMADRLALAALSLAVDIEVSARAGVEPCTTKARPWLADGLALIGATATNPPSRRLTGDAKHHRNIPGGFNMLDHERRSYAPLLPPPESTGQKPRKRRERPDVSCPDAPARVPLPSPDAMVEEIEETDEVDAIDFLSAEARRDVLASAVAGFGGGRL